MAPKKSIVGIHTNTKLIDPKTKKALESYIRPKSSCKKCHGRGFTGWYNEGGDQVKVWECVCLVSAICKYADKHNIMIDNIKIELLVDEEKTATKIITAGGW